MRRRLRVDGTGRGDASSRDRRAHGHRRAAPGIIRLLLGRGSRLALLGALAGLPLAIGAARLVQGLLFNTSPWTPGIWLVLPAALLATVLLASFLPARRASLVDPAVALRQE